VEFDDVSIRCRRPVRLVEAVQWLDLQAVIIMTTDQGPLLDDVFWVLVGKNSGCVEPRMMPLQIDQAVVARTSDLVGQSATNFR